MRAWILAGGLLAGCGFEVAPIFTDAPPDQNLDPDGDGIVTNDNCPTAKNADQRDFDGDGRGDVCDLCPHIASAADNDADGDGIGEACDPQPQKGTDRVALWEGFDDVSSFAAWTPGAPGTWAWDAGTVRQDSSSPGDRSLTAPLSYQRISVATSFQVVGVGAGGSIGFCTGVVFAAQRYCCTISASGPTLVALSFSAGAGANPSTSWPGTFTAGDRIQLVQNPATGNRCDASQGASQASLSAFNGTTAGKFELFTASAAAAFDYVFVVELGN